MQHIHDLADLQLDRCDLTIGSFDGVHVGHQALVKSMVSHAHLQGNPAAVLTFFPHPSVVLRGRTPAFYITKPEEKADLLGELGVDYVITQTFDEELSRVSAKDFVQLLLRQLNFNDLWIGEDFALGHDREGDRIFLAREGTQEGFKLHVVAPVFMAGEVVSSTRVREALRSGDVGRVETYLGRPFALPGTVVPGAGRGKGLGIPTANLEIWEQRAYPRSGVYACLARIGGAPERWKSVTNIGIRPTFENNQSEAVVEAHLLDFEGDMYGQHMELEFVARLRDERKFANAEALLARISRDINRARAILDSRLEADDDGGV
ncbi:MAG: bifunctional riboflavin kinase/FAD synthetase [Anaerolineales bacterium]|jgi:riboflavin kinase/FMN adenylyltransferase